MGSANQVIRQRANGETISNDVHVIINFFFSFSPLLFDISGSVINNIPLGKIVEINGRELN